MSSIFEDILTNIETMVSAIVEGDGIGSGSGSAGYNFSWPDTVNVHDMAVVKPGPYLDIFAEREKIEEEFGNQGGMYDATLSLRLEVGFKYETKPTNPIRQGEIDAMKCYDDLKRLFGIDAVNAAGSDTGAFSFQPSGEAIFEYPSNDVLIPVRLHTFWKAKYFADRLNPDLRAIA